MDFLINFFFFWWPTIGSWNSKQHTQASLYLLREGYHLGLSGSVKMDNNICYRTPLEVWAKRTKESIWKNQA